MVKKKKTERKKCFWYVKCKICRSTWNCFNVYVKCPHLEHKDRLQKHICDLLMPSKYRHCMYRLTVVTETILFTYQSIIIFCFYLTWPLPNVLAYEEYAFKPLNPAAKCKRSQRYPFVLGVWNNWYKLI